MPRLAEVALELISARGTFDCRCFHRDLVAVRRWPIVKLEHNGHLTIGWNGRVGGRGDGTPTGASLADPRAALPRYRKSRRTPVWLDVTAKDCCSLLRCIIFAFSMQHFDGQRDPLTAANAKRNEAALQTVSAH